MTEDIDLVDERTDYSKPNMQAAYERNMYQLPSPPMVFDDLQEYIVLYVTEKDDKYFAWFLHFYEPMINRIVNSWLNRFGMDNSHFAGLKSACVCGIWETLIDYDVSTAVPFVRAIQRPMQVQMLDYIRVMRPALSVPKNSEYRTQRRIMAVFKALGGVIDDDTVAKISEKLGIGEKTVRKHILLAIRAQDVASTDDDGQELLYANCLSEPETAFFRSVQFEEILKAYYSLDYRERYIVAARLDFCPECITVTERDSHGLDRRKEKKPTFEALANDFGLRSANAAEDIYYGAIEKMRKK